VLAFAGARLCPSFIVALLAGYQAPARVSGHEVTKPAVSLKMSRRGKNKRVVAGKKCRPSNTGFSFDRGNMSLLPVLESNQICIFAVDDRNFRYVRQRRPVQSAND